MALWVQDERDERDRHPGALLFVRWSPDGANPDGHFETDWLVRGSSVEDARERLGAFSLYDVKAMLDELITAGRAEDF